MDVDTTAHDPTPSSSSAAGGSSTRGDKRGQGPGGPGGPPTNGKAGTIAGALVPDTAPQFAVSQYAMIDNNNNYYYYGKILNIIFSIDLQDFVSLREPLINIIVECIE